MELTSNEQQDKSEQARRSHDFLVSMLTKDVSNCMFIIMFNFVRGTFCVFSEERLKM